jgi:hypothetical protein
MTEIEDRFDAEVDEMFCEYCGWCEEYPHSHIEHCRGFGCKYITSKYDVWINEDGELEWKLKEKK